MNIVKESLAKLLATENLIVEHRAVETAAFNVTDRILTLPTWEHECNDVTDMFIAHEVGHALYTPDNDEWLEDLNQQFLNVTEDIRIEKLIKRRYEGLPKTFFKGYAALDIDEFFGLTGKDLSQLNLADKINLYYKIGNYRDIPFTTEEKAFLPKCDALETFKEAVELALEIQAYCKDQFDKEQDNQETPDQEQQQQQQTESTNESGQSENTTDSSESEQGDNGESPFDNLEPVDQHKEDVADGEEGDEWHGNPTIAGRGNGPQDAQGMPEVSTAKAAESAQKKLVNRAAGENTYVEVPNEIPIDYLVDNKTIADVMDKHYSVKEQIDLQESYPDAYSLDEARRTAADLTKCDADFRAFKVSANKEVNYLVKEFEMKKAADGYARATTSRTGVLDTANLHTYKYNDDLFKKITTIPDAKSHGLIFNIDWSGSMHHNILDTIKQTLTLVSFCRKVGIDYDVYLFTDAYHKHSTSYHDLCGQIEGHVILDNFNMLNVLTSKSNNRQHDRQALNLFRIAYTICYRSYIGIPYTMNMGGTPLNESLLSMNELIPAFKKRTGAQKIHVVCLTDGDGHPLRAGRKMQGRGYNADEIYASHMGAGYFLRDRKTGKMYAFEGGYYYSQTNQYVHYLRDRFPECSIMNIRLLASGEWHRFKQSCLGHEYNEENVKRADQIWRKTKTFICTASAWSVQYGLAASALKNDAEFEVDENATKAQIKKAFTKSLGSKKMNKKILSSFIAQIA